VVSSKSPDSFVETVVLIYFLMVDEAELLLDLLGDPIAVPRIVFDPDEPEGVDDDTRCEISRSIGYHRRLSRDPTRDEAAQQTAGRSADRIATMTQLHERARVVVINLTADELELVGRLTSRETCSQFGLRFPLDAGEAACLALATARNLTLATDHSDALTALKKVSENHPYQRIRRLLIAAGQRGLRTEAEANEIHSEMRRLGFWDTTKPFPQH
jgi:predicted nucleic acid-binding protein